MKNTRILKLSGIFGGVILLCLFAYFSLEQDSGKTPELNSIPPVSGNYISPSNLDDLKEKALSGDPISQYEMTVFGTDDGNAEMWLKSAADQGYLPAMFDYAKSRKGMEKKSLLEKLAKRGYVQAMEELIVCIDNSSCGEKSELEELMWINVASALTNKGNKSLPPAVQIIETSLKSSMAKIEQKQAIDRAQILLKRIDANPILRNSNVLSVHKSE